MNTNETKKAADTALRNEEINLKATGGMSILILNLALMLISIIGFIFSIYAIATYSSAFWGMLIICVLYFSVIGPILFCGLKILKPNEALVLTLFGKYHGTLRGEGFFFVNPFVTAFNPTASTSYHHGSTQSAESNALANAVMSQSGMHHLSSYKKSNKVISLKSMTLDNEKQKINDELGNPIIIGIVVIWKVANTAKAVFNVDNYMEFLSIQCDSALRDIVRLYPYDASAEDGEKSLRGSSQEVAERLKAEIQSRVNIAGLEVAEARITHLAYAPEIAAAMLQRQQASAIIAARQMIVEGAVGMVEMALSKLNEKEIVALDEERKAAMVSNLLVVLCGNKDPQPIVNSGSIY